MDTGIDPEQSVSPSSTDWLQEWDVCTSLCHINRHLVLNIPSWHFKTFSVLDICSSSGETVNGFSCGNAESTSVMVFVKTCTCWDYR